MIARLKAADWQNVRHWCGDMVERIYVSNRDGVECGYFQLGQFQKTVHLSLHEALLCSVVGWQAPRQAASATISYGNGDGDRT